VTVAADRLVRSRTWLTKVPAITATFWVIKVLSTTIGETFADYLTVNVGLGPAVTDAIMFAALVAALVVQFRTSRYTPWIYWLCVVLVSIFGTQVTDFFTDTLGVSLYVSTAVFTVILAVVFAVWYRQEHALAIASVDTPRREGFYWAAILTTRAGTRACAWARPWCRGTASSTRPPPEPIMPSQSSDLDVQRLSSGLDLLGGGVCRGVAVVECRRTGAAVAVACRALQDGG
jgi:uncharacterized membrane protein YwzB